MLERDLLHRRLEQRRLVGGAEARRSGSRPRRRRGRSRCGALDLDVEGAHPVEDACARARAFWPFAQPRVAEHAGRERRQAPEALLVQRRGVSLEDEELELDRELRRETQLLGARDDASGAASAGRPDAAPPCSSRSRRGTPPCPAPTGWDAAVERSSRRARRGSRCASR